MLTPSDAAGAAGKEIVGVAGGHRAVDVGSGSSSDSLADLVLVPDTADSRDMDACGQRDGETLQTQAKKRGGSGSEPYDAIRRGARGGEAGHGSFEKIRTSIGDIRRCLCLNGGSLSSVAPGSGTGGSR